MDEQNSEPPAIGNRVPRQEAQGSLIALQAWLVGPTWRPAGAWFVLAGLLATAGLRVQEQSLITVLLSVFLADGLWGGAWAQIAGWPGAGSARRSLFLRLPYANPGGMAVQASDLSAFLGTVLPVSAIALALSVAISPAAIGLTLLALALALAGLLAGRARLVAVKSWLHALLVVVLPLALGASLAIAWPESQWWLWLLAAGFALAVQPALAAARGSTFVLAQVGLGAALVVLAVILAGHLLTAAVLALVASGPLLLVARGEPPARPAVQPWWLLMLAVSAFSIGLGIG